MSHKFLKWQISIQFAEPFTTCHRGGHKGLHIPSENPSPLLFSASFFWSRNIGWNVPFPSIFLKHLYDVLDGSFHNDLVKWERVNRNVFIAWGFDRSNPFIKWVICQRTQGTNSSCHWFFFFLLGPQIVFEREPAAPVYHGQGIKWAHLNCCLELLVTRLVFSLGAVVLGLVWLGPIDFSAFGLGYHSEAVV